MVVVITVLVLSEGRPKFFLEASLGRGPQTMAGWVAEGRRLCGPGVVQVPQVASLGRGPQAPAGWVAEGQCLRGPGVVQRGAGVLQVAYLGQEKQAPIG